MGPLTPESAKRVSPGVFCVKESGLEECNGKLIGPGVISSRIGLSLLQRDYKGLCGWCGWGHKMGFFTVVFRILDWRVSTVPDFIRSASAALVQRLKIGSNWAQSTDRQAKTLDSHALLVAAVMVAKSRSRQRKYEGWLKSNAHMLAERERRAPKSARGGIWKSRFRLITYAQFELSAFSKCIFRCRSMDTFTGTLSLRAVTDFLLNIETGDESWVHYYDPEEKRQSTEYRDASSPRPKKFKIQPSAKKKKKFF
uniref:Uncharacterized protein n=1 Tax=Rhodnius prolixus TaxID=13249 RepID=T1HMG3_RHOPR